MTSITFIFYVFVVNCLKLAKNIFLKDIQDWEKAGSTDFY